MQRKTKKIVLAALIAALTCVATMVVKVPSPMKGYINLGDCVVLAGGWLLSPVWGFLSGGLGSALSDVLSGYMTYAPATFLIKGLMAIVAHYGFKLLHNKCGNLVARVISGVAAEILMIAGYFVFEGFLYGFGPVVVNIPANAVQGAAGVAIGIVLMKALEQGKIITEIRSI